MKLFTKYSKRKKLLEVLPSIESAWKGHEFFAYDLVRNVEPNVIVELGTHWGYSFYAMLEAVKDSKLNTKMIAVDTWEGDSQAGKYSEKVWEFFRKQVKKNKGQNIVPLRMTFDDALNKVSDKVDLLHIDGLHTYEAVKNDFESWLPKMSKNGIILLHDIEETKDDFGVYRLWGELEKKYKTIKFVHSHGLGVVSMSGNIPMIDKDYYYLLNDRRLECLVDEKNREIIKTNKKLIKTTRNLYDKMNKVAAYEKELNTIKSSKIWKLSGLAKKVAGNK